MTKIPRIAAGDRNLKSCQPDPILFLVLAGRWEPVKNTQLNDGPDPFRLLGPVNPRVPMSQFERIARVDG